MVTPPSSRRSRHPPRHGRATHLPRSQHPPRSTPRRSQPCPRWSRCEPRAASLETRRDNKPPNHIETETSKSRTPTTPHRQETDAETRCPQAELTTLPLASNTLARYTGTITPISHRGGAHDRIHSP
ncbi:hypothetical protein EF294_04080 [Gordonia oryzae]|uniref:Uncharacterized protein n=1 Tax=Gordonia oryzae TaxID=2487349 RepID=A0A3N4GSG2_9ACTN|nr:hypothetical protein EF294_04080 [Gordonia oryzae]